MCETRPENQYSYIKNKTNRKSDAGGSKQNRGPIPKKHARAATPERQQCLVYLLISVFISVFTLFAYFSLFKQRG